MRDVIELTREMVAFDTTSSNSNLELACFLKELLEKMGLSVSFQEKTENGVRKANVIARIGPKNVEPLMLSAHMDVMPVGNLSAWTFSSNPFDLTEQDGKLYGRGSVDMKGPLAAMICGIEPLISQASQFRRELMFGLTYDEEVGLIGAKRLVNAKIIKPKFVLIAEPTELVPMRMHKGHLCLTAYCWGKGGHAAFPQIGRNAIEIAEKVIAKLKEFGEQLKCVEMPGFTPPYTTINIAEVRGGGKINKIPGQCEVDFAIRMIPGLTTQRIRDDITQRLEKIGYDEKGLSIVTVGLYMKESDRIADEEKFQKATKTREDLTKRIWVIENERRKIGKKEPTEPMQTPASSELVRTAEAVAGVSARGVCFSTDASEFQRMRADCLIFGPGNIYDGNGHEPNEYIEIDQLLKGVDQFREIARRMLLEGGLQ